MVEADVVVVGAGPAGSAAATYLARSGRDVVVVDRAHFPRDKCCGDGLTTLALRELENLGLRPEAVASWTTVQDVSLHGPTGRRVDLRLPEGSGTYAAVTRRRDLDAALVDLAAATGARVRQGATVVAANQTAGGIVVSFADGEPLFARHVVAADGMWSPLRRMLGGHVEGYRGDWHAFRQYFDDVGDQAATALHVFFEADLLPGYAWSFPLPNGRANVGFGILRGGRINVGDMGARWAELQRRGPLAEVLGPDATPQDTVRAWPIPARLGAVPLRIGRALFVGDAAAVTDAMTGEGIGQALLTGRLAAEAIVGGQPYEAAVRDALALDHSAALVLGRLLSRPAVTSLALRAVDLHAWTRRNFVRWMFEDYPRAVLARPSRWRRGLLSGPGAFASPGRPVGS